LIALYRDRRRTSRDVKRLALGHVEDLNRKIAELAAIRNVLLDLALKCRGDDRPECPILDELGSGAGSVSNPIASGTTDQVKQ
jgi:MerR family transcriptional regulator, copper efflux regulator